MDVHKPRIEERIANGIVVLGGGPAGHAVWAAIPEAILLEAETETVATSVGRNRVFGPHLLGEELPEFHVHPRTLLNYIDDREPNERSVAAYRAKIGSDKKTPWNDQFAVRGMEFEIVQWPNAVVSYDCRVKGVNLDERRIDMASSHIFYKHLINTLPMPIFWRMTHWKRGFDMNFRWEPVRVWVFDEGTREEQFRLQNDLHRYDIYVNYITDHRRLDYRETWRNGKVYVESLHDELSPRNPLKPTHTHYPGKIWNLSQDGHDAMTEEGRRHDVHFAGRYGAWVQNELLSDTYHRAMKIRKEIGL